MRALIIGGGVAGPAAALSLVAAGHRATVVERRSAAEAAVGSYLTLAPNGLSALAALGVLDEVRAVGFPSRANLMFGATGRRLGRISLGAPVVGDLVALTLPRSQLAVRLSEAAAARGVAIRRGRAAGSVHQGPDGVTAELDDGTLIEADLLVGADGVGSLVRRVVDPGAPRGRYVGLTNFGGITAGSPLAATLEPEAWHFVFGRRAFFGAHPTPDGDVVWFVNVPEPEITRKRRAETPPDAWQRRLVDLLADDAGPGAELVAAGRLELAGDNTYDLPHVPVWGRGRMIIVGDAAHAPSPSSGQGASLALEDAVVLGRALQRQPGPDAVPAALASYVRQRRPRVERVVAAGARTSSTKVPGPAGRWLTETILRAVFRYAVTEQSTSWMHGYRLDRPAIDGEGLQAVDSGLSSNPNGTSPGPG